MQMLLEVGRATDLSLLSAGDVKLPGRRYVLVTPVAGVDKFVWYDMRVADNGGTTVWQTTTAIDGTDIILGNRTFISTRLASLKSAIDLLQCQGSTRHTFESLESAREFIHGAKTADEEWVDWAEGVVGVMRANTRAGSSYSHELSDKCHSGLKPELCCDMGSYKCQVPTHIKGRRQDIDLCIADLVAALNAANIQTAASCCGHGHQPGNIVLDDGRVLQVYTEPAEVQGNAS